MKNKPWSTILAEFDPRYFSSTEWDDPFSLEQAAYKLATWFFDNEK